MFNSSTQSDKRSISDIKYSYIIAQVCWWSLPAVLCCMGDTSRIAIEYPRMSLVYCRFSIPYSHVPNLLSNSYGNPIDTIIAAWSADTYMHGCRLHESSSLAWMGPKVRVMVIAITCITPSLGMSRPAWCRSWCWYAGLCMKEGGAADHNILWNHFSDTQHIL